MHQRMIAVFCVITLLMTGAIFRVYYIDTADYLTAASTIQGNYRLDVGTTRGNIYDRNLRPMVNREYQYVAAVMPTPQVATVLLERTEDEAERAAVLEQLSEMRPYIMLVEDSKLYADGIDVFRLPLRYGTEQLAPHVIGYLNGDGTNGAAGVEKALDELLAEKGGGVQVVYRMDAMGHAMTGGGATVRRINEDPKGGVVLSLDSQIQTIAQNALSAGTDKGAVVVMEIDTGDILAMASIPAFDQNNLAASLESEDAPFINRAVSGYNIGSVFKLVVSAAALENNISQYHQYECKGYIDVEGQIFRCNNHAVHGVIDMKRALEVSCNTYFIHLMQEMGPQYTLALCEHMGIGTAAELAPGMYTQAGNLPGKAELNNPAGLANFSFGQGSSLATPLQMAQVVSIIAGGGSGVSPRLVHGVTLDGETLTERSPVYASNQVLSAKTAATLTQLMIDVVEEGSGRTARPLEGGAGGKTSSAQTGIFVEDSDGEEKEIVHAWFAGFYPADTPKYAVVVFCEGGESGEQVAAPIFKQIVDGISGLNR